MEKVNITYTDITTTAGKLKVMKHFDNGGKIWVDCGDKQFCRFYLEYVSEGKKPTWDWDTFNYRISDKSPHEVPC